MSGKGRRSAKSKILCDQCNLELQCDTNKKDFM